MTRDILKILDDLKPEDTPDRYYVGWNEALDAVRQRVTDDDHVTKAKNILDETFEKDFAVWSSHSCATIRAKVWQVRSLLIAALRS